MIFGVPLVVLEKAQALADAVLASLLYLLALATGRAACHCFLSGSLGFLVNMGVCKTLFQLVSWYLVEQHPGAGEARVRTSDYHDSFLLAIWLGEIAKGYHGVVEAFFLQKVV